MKTIMLFENSTLWETQNNCLFCEIADKLYNEVIISNDENYKQEILNRLDNNYLVDGYGLLITLEQVGYIITDKNKIKEINEYNINIYREESDHKHVIHSRWCKKCASRKPDIYDESRI